MNSAGVKLLSSDTRILLSGVCHSERPDLARNQTRGDEGLQQLEHAANPRWPSPMDHTFCVQVVQHTANKFGVIMYLEEGQLYVGLTRS